MFGFFKNKDKIAKDIVNNICVDMHSHLIPKVDDGVRSLEDSIFIISRLSKLGYKKLIITPHIMIDAYPNEPKNLKNKLEELKEAVKDRGIEIDLEVAAEYYLDEGFKSHLDSEPLLINNEYILFETSYMSKPINMKELIYEISAKGFKAIFAHPERYRYIKDLKKEYEELKSLGIYFQVDINSFGGLYGKSAKEKANFLMESGMIDFLGSDIHKKSHLESLNNLLLENKKLFDSLFNRNKILNKTLI